MKNPLNWTNKLKENLFNEIEFHLKELAIMSPILDKHNNINGMPTIA